MSGDQNLKRKYWRENMTKIISQPKRGMRSTRAAAAIASPRVADMEIGRRTKAEARLVFDKKLIYRSTGCPLLYKYVATIGGIREQRSSTITEVKRFQENN